MGKSLLFAMNADVALVILSPYISGGVDIINPKKLLRTTKYPGALSLRKMSL
jgi:hypothetical protein